MIRKIKLSRWAKEHDMQYLAAWKMAKAGYLKIEVLPTGKFLVVEEIEDISLDTKTVIYARVSNPSNKENCESQRERLKQYCNAKGYQISEAICEYGSGLNDSRPKWLKILCDKSIKRIVVEHKDRFSRFGFNAFQHILNSQNREIEVADLSENKDDIIQDFIAIITSYCAKIYGHRRSKNKAQKLIEDLEIKDTK
jgi:predicted site-specific integrase-resolvase